MNWLQATGQCAIERYLSVTMRRLGGKCDLNLNILITGEQAQCI